MAEKQYDIDKKAFQKQRADILDAAKDRQKILATSTDGSVDNLKKTFPDLDKDALKKVKEIMVGGEVTALFFNKDGSYTDNAATKVALVLFGESEIGKAEDRLTKSQEALKDTVSKGSDSPKVKTGQSQQTHVPEQITKMFADVFEKRYY